MLLYPKFQGKPTVRMLLKRLLLTLSHSSPHHNPVLLSYNYSLWQSTFQCRIFFSNAGKVCILAENGYGNLRARPCQELSESYITGCTPVPGYQDSRVCDTISYGTLKSQFYLSALPKIFNFADIVCYDYIGPENVCLD